MRQRGIVLRPGAVGVSGLALLTLLTACGATAGSTDRLATPGPGVTGVTPVTPSSGSITDTPAPTDGPEGAVGRIILRTYQSWWDARITAFGRSDSDGTQL